MEDIVDSILEKLQKDRPLFHDDGTGNLITWNSNINLLKKLEEMLDAGMHTLEVGSGYSTVVFTYKKCHHTCIVPIQDEVDRISAYCLNENISLEGTEFMVGESFRYLPSMSARYDLIFIDGAHRFPFPIIDWFYCAILLKENGLIVIDDTDIVSCYLLLQFMLNDSHWEAFDVRENFGIFRKKGDHDYPCDWCGQNFSKNKIDTSNAFLENFLHRPEDSYEQKDDTP